MKNFFSFAAFVIILILGLINGGYAMEMDHGANDKYSDRAFLSGMIAHHEGAMAMAEDVLKKGKHPQIENWARQILKDQQAEIGQMKALLAQKGGEDKKAYGEMQKSMHTMMAKPMPGDPDRNFLNRMIPHHAEGVVMALDAIVYSEDPQVVKIAENIATEQLKEMKEYRKWLEDNLIR